MRRFAPLFTLGALLVLAPPAARAQEPVEPVFPGQLLRAGVPHGSGTIVLHRVTPEEAGDIDSVSVGPDGRFELRLPYLPVPGSGEVFFASTRYQDIVYFGAPLYEPAHLDSLYLIEVFPSEPAPAAGYRFPVGLREVFVEEGPMGWRVTDAFIVVNEAPATFVADGEGGVVWSYPLLPGAEGIRILEIGPVQGEVRFSGSTMIASNPVVPGRNFFAVQYDMPSIELDMALPGEVDAVRLVLREPAPALRVEGLARLPPEELEFGESFLQWGGQELRDQVVRVRLGEEPELQTVAWLTVMLALLLVGAGVWVVARTPLGVPGWPKGVPDGAPRTSSSASRSRREVLLDVARLDEDFSRLEAPDEEARERYRRRRETLLGELEEGGVRTPRS